MDLRRAAPGFRSRRSDSTELAAPRMAWRGAVSASAVMLVERPALVAIGLAGFLARGGLLLFVLPVVVLPTTVGISNWIGATSITASGPTASLVWLLALAAIGASVAFLAGVVIGAAADLLLFREARDRVGEQDGAPPPLGPAIVLRLAAIRLAALVPFALAVAWAASRVAAATYHELILPEELVTPLVLRVVDESRDALAVVFGAWLLSETLGGIAIRHYLLRGGSTAMALLRPIGDVVLRPITSVATLGLGLFAAVVAIAPLLLIAWLAWGRLRIALVSAESIPLMFGTLAFVAIWLTALVAAGTVASWRSLLGSFEVLRTRGATLPAATTLPLAPAPLEPVGGRPAG